MTMMTIDLSKAASAPLNPTNIHECLQLPVPPHITLTIHIHNIQYTMYVLQIQKYNCAIVSQQIIPSTALSSTQPWKTQCWRAF